MQRSGKRGKFRTPYSSAPAGYSRARAQRRGAYRARQRRPFRVGYDRTGGFYGRFSGANAERKFFNTAVDDAVVAATMTINNLTVVPEGNGESARIGRKITIRSIHVKGMCKLAAAAGASSTSDQVTCMLVQDTQTNGAPFVATDLIDADVFDEFRNLANSRRFKILHKSVFSMNAGGAAPSGAALVFSEFQRKLNVNVRCNIPIEYDNTASDGSIGTVRTNNVYWVTQAESGVSGIAANARIRYTDV